MPSSFSKSSFARTGMKTQRRRVKFNDHTSETPFNKHLSIQDMSTQDKMSVDHFTPQPQKRKPKKRKPKTRKSAKKQKKSANKTRKHSRKNIHQKARYNVVKQRRIKDTTKR
jgi:hypothetical protein